jgi:SAM-dependent methyltransferase
MGYLSKAMTINDQIRSDFDRIAPLADDSVWNHNNHYHDFLLKQIPAHCDRALEIGCGTGGFARLLATRAIQVVGIDLSPEMIRIATEQSQKFGSITYQVADLLTLDLPPFNYVSSIATLHHIPLQEALLKIKSLIAPGGVLAVLDLFQEETPWERLPSLLAAPYSRMMRLLKTGKLHESPELMTAYAEHGKTDHYLHLSEIRAICRDVLPGAIVRQHLLWRYSIVWRKDG